MTQPAPQVGKNAFDELMEEMKVAGVAKNEKIDPDKILNKLNRLEDVVEDLAKTIKDLTNKKKKCRCKKEKVLKD